MRSRRVLLVMMGLASFAAEARMWTDANGKTVEAELVSCTNRLAILKTGDGKTIRAPVDKLSKDDQDFLRLSQTPQETAVAAPAVAGAVPTVGQGFVGTPEFDIKGGPLSGGTCFFAQGAAAGDVLLVTAHHIFGPACGLKEEVPQKDMPHFARKVSFDDLAGPKHFSAPAEFAPGLETKDIDLAAYRFGAKPGVAAHKFAAKNPEKGEAIWLVARLSGLPKDELLHRGVVDAVWPDKLRCKFDNGNLVLRGASGGPYINVQGEIVGLHTSSWKDPGQVAGAVLPVESIRAALSMPAP